MSQRPSFPAHIPGLSVSVLILPNLTSQVPQPLLWKYTIQLGNLTTTSVHSSQASPPLLSRRLSGCSVCSATMDPPQTTLCHRPSLLIVHPGVRIIGAQHWAAIMPQDQGGSNYWRRTLAFVRELILNRSFDVSMLQSLNYFSQKSDLY